MKRCAALLCLVCAALLSPRAIAESPPTAVRAGTSHRVIAADSSTKTMASIAPDGKVEWKLPCGPIHDLHLLPDGHILSSDGWTRIVELDADRKPIWHYNAKRNGNAGPEQPQIIGVTPEKQVVWTFKDFQTFGNSLPVAVVLDS